MRRDGAPVLRSRGVGWTRTAWRADEECAGGRRRLLIVGRGISMTDDSTSSMLHGPDEEEPLHGDERRVTECHQTLERVKQLSFSRSRSQRAEYGMSYEFGRLVAPRRLRLRE